jgi:hypothetical protein
MACSGKREIEAGKASLAQEKGLRNGQIGWKGLVNLRAHREWHWLRAHSIPRGMEGAFRVP